MKSKELSNRSLWEYLIAFFNKDNFDPDAVTCSIDGEEVDCETWEVNDGKG
tara:strand:+ start:14 stop:166 length:153 start_codon:yes stop_codon:yes gene_type:complete